MDFRTSARFIIFNGRHIRYLRTNNPTNINPENDIFDLNLHKSYNMSLLDKIRAFFSRPSSEANNPPDRKLSHQNMDANKTTEEVPVLSKAKDFIADTMEEVKDQSAHLWEEVKDKASDLNEATRPYREQLADKAKDALEKIDDFVDKTVEKAKAFEATEKSKDLNSDGLSDQPIDFGKSVFEEKEEFFKKAEKWLEQNESGEKIHDEDSEASNVTNKNKMIHPLELPKDPE